MYNALMYGCFIVCRLKEAVGLFNEMLLKNFKLDGYTFNLLVDGLCKEGEVKKN